jgi:hypothetical protein
LLKTPKTLKPITLFRQKLSMDPTNLETTISATKPKGSRLITNGHPEGRAPFKRLGVVDVILLCIGIPLKYERIKRLLVKSDSLVTIWAVMNLGHVMFLVGTMSLIGWWVLGALV